ncbi:SDR family oxidoreductase [Pontibacter cellulosilyticus]|uniref:SDR family oxidoreductase n=1 Tax=Pontibacter cellulosilyticus TaxID=1720253 RepID=A0A923SH39_9BACT|nr:SDR family oxidoreductase [Pontibacter cellulosilyticus]MBC5991329.1 SDR family oxidoreductase [Pontibacter cellulosilyticus]
MKKVLLAGATGNLGRHYLQALKQQGYTVRVLARSAAKAKALSPAPDEIFIADATQPQALAGCCEGIDVVVSALGKSISLTDKSKASFFDVDFTANNNLLQEARRSEVKQFIYTSAFGAAKHPELAYIKAHHDFAEALKSSGVAYTILEPTALFSAFDEVVSMAQKGQIGSLGAGDKLTNPVFEGDLAQVAVQSIGKPSQVIPVGGQQLYSRLELIKIACEAAGHRGKIPSVPFGVVKAILPVVKLVSRNMYDKVAFLVAVSEIDCVAPRIGEHTLEEYFNLPHRKATQV